MGFKLNGKPFDGLPSRALAAVVAVDLVGVDVVITNATRVVDDENEVNQVVALETWIFRHLKPENSRRGKHEYKPCWAKHRFENTVSKKQVVSTRNARALKLWSPSYNKRTNCLKVEILDWKVPIRKKNSDRKRRGKCKNFRRIT